MNYQIADARTRFFNDKEHYLNFLAAWKRAANSVNAKATKDKFYGNKVDGWLTGAHMLLYTLVRGRDIRPAFTLVTNETKLTNGFYINHGLYWAAQDLIRIAGYVKNDREWSNNIVDEFLAPFNGTFEKERLVELVEAMPEIKAIYSDYGKGRAIAERIIEDGSIDPWDLIEEAA